MNPVDLLGSINSEKDITPSKSITTIPASLVYNPYFKSPFVNYTPYNLLSPLNTGYYTNLNNDKTVIKTVVKYFYYKIIDKWLHSDLLPLLGYINVNNGKASLIKDLDHYKNTTDSVEDIDAKIDFIENTILDKDLVKQFLKRIVSKNNIKWYLLYKHQDFVKEKLYKYIKEELENAI
jgi:hypothetical protein